MIKKYIQYIKNNPENYWFRARWYGWGWVPATWQGWLTTTIYVFIGIILGIALENNEQTKYSTPIYLLVLTTITLSFIFLTYKKGEKPKWSFGPPSNT